MPLSAAVLLGSVISYSYYIIGNQFKDYLTLLAISILSGVFALVSEILGVLIMVKIVKVQFCTYMVLLYSSHLFVMIFLVYIELYDEISDINWVMWVCVATQVLLGVILVLNTYLGRKLKKFSQERDYNLIKILIDKSTISYSNAQDNDLENPLTYTEKSSQL